MTDTIEDIYQPAAGPYPAVPAYEGEEQGVTLERMTSERARELWAEAREEYHRAKDRNLWKWAVSLRLRVEALDRIATSAVLRERKERPRVRKLPEDVHARPRPV